MTVASALSKSKASPSSPRRFRPTDLDNVWLGVLQVKQQRHQPIQDLLKEGVFAIPSAEPGQRPKEDDGGRPELVLLLSDK